MRLLHTMCACLLLPGVLLPVAHGREAELRPWDANPWYWSWGGEPLLLLGGSDDDNIFQWPEKELIAQLDRLAAAGGNVVRNTMSDRKDKGFEIYPFRQEKDGKYNLNKWNREYWTRFERMLRETEKRRIVVQIEVWDRFDFTDSGGADRWQIHPYNPKNNVNYTAEESGFADRYPDHPGTNRQPFFFTTPDQRNNTVVLQYQQRFVEKMLDHTLKHGNVLYCMDNETSGEEAWGKYWAGFIKERAARKGRTVFVTEMWDDWNLRDDIHRRTFDHPERYDFVDVSQNNHNSGDKHWDNFLYVRGYLSPKPRPMNTIKTYGANGNKFGHSDQDGIERFWRHLLAGAAAMRFHRPDSGLGLNDKAVAAIRAARKLESKMTLWSLKPANDLLSEREPNEAYLAANPGTAYALYLPAGGRVRVDLSAAKGPLTVHWISIASGEWGPVQEIGGGGNTELAPPDGANWAAAIISTGNSHPAKRRPSIVTSPPLAGATDRMAAGWRDGTGDRTGTLFGRMPHLELLTGAVPDPPSYGELSQGSLKVRLFPTQTKPCLQHYISLGAGASSSNYISTVERLGLSGSWALMSLLPDDGLEQYIATGDPIACYFTIQAIQNHQVENNAPLLTAMDYVEKNRKGFHTFGVCEWENTFYRHWEKETDTTAIYGASPSELSRMDRKGNYEVLERTARRWKASARDRMMMANGYGMLAHLAEVGLDAIGIETSETIPATQVKRAFARGAARQFGIPWFEEVSVWFGASVSGGMPTSAIVHWPNTPVGGNAGHSVSHLMRHWFTSWFSGAGHVMLEASPQVLFEVPWSSEFPADAKLSRYGIEAQRLAGLMKRLDIGVPYTPFAVLINKYHGRWAVWGKPWGRLEETPGDQMTERFFDQVFPGQSQGPGKEERYLCSSPYGDTFDVLVNDAARDAWRAYPVILAVGDIPWTAEDIEFLKGYVQDGGILALNEVNLEGWDRTWLGLASAGFAASAEAQTVLSGNDGQPRLIRRTVGGGCVLVASSNPEPSLNQSMAFPDELLRSLACQYIPFRVEGDVQTLINRTKDGWALMVVNNKGITKELHVDQAPVITSSATQQVCISFQGKLAQVSEVIYGCKLQTETNDTGTGQHIRFDLPPGELRLIKIKE